MIYYIDTQDLMDKYSKRSDDNIESTNYIILSSRVINTEPRGNVYNLYNMFMSLDTLKGVDIKTDIHSIRAREEFKGYLLKQPKLILFLVEVILNDITTAEDTVIILTPNERKNGNINVFTDVIYDIFGYRILEYPKEQACDIDDVTSRLDYYRDEATMLAFSLENTFTRAQMLKTMSKKDIKKLMKRRGLAYQGLDRSEMITMLLEG